MANLKTKTVEFSVESFVFLFNYVRKIVEDYNKIIERHYERLEYVVSHPDEDLKIYDHEIESFEEAKKDIFNFSPIQEMLLGIYDYSALHTYFDSAKEFELKEKFAMMDTAKRFVKALKIDEVK